MGGLGNGRRGGRSPPLMIGALIACILLLGFNYWVSSSRNLDLQTKLYELESQVRRGAAERGAAETKESEYQEEIQKQKAQIINMERQLEEAQYSCIQQKNTLQQNVSSSTKTIQDLKGQLNQLNNDLKKLQNKLQSCQGNINSLNNKLTYDMTNCNSQLVSQKELCDEKVAAVRLEVQKYKPAQHVPPPQEKAVGGDLKEKQLAVAGAVVTTASHTPSHANKELEVLTNEIVVGKVLDDSVDLSPPEDLSKAESLSVTSAPAVKQSILPPPEGAVKTHHTEAESSKLLKDNLTEKVEVEVMDAHEQGTQTVDPGMEGMLIGQRKEAETPIGQKLEDTLEYEADDQVVGGVDLEKEQQNKQAENMDRDMEEEELADYNGDDENEGENEAGKQAELAQN